MVCQRLFRNGFTWLTLFLSAVSWRVGAFSLVSTEGGKVRVHVEESLDVPCEQAQEAWLDYQWQRGGGLLGVYVWTSDKTNTRRVAPIWIQERLLGKVEQSVSSPNKNPMIQYKVTDMGLVSFDLDASSHSATVQFVSNPHRDANTTTMIWDVEFQAQHRRELWQAITQFNLQTAASNLNAYVATPSYYQRTTFLQSDLSIKQLMEEWKTFIWHQGGGLPIPPPVRWNDQDRMIVPPFLMERLQSMEQSSISADNRGIIRYTVVNPGIFTYPVHTHAGRISFTQEEDEGIIKMVWEVQVRPFAGCTPLVQGFTSTVVSTLARNFQAYILDGPNATVAVAPPRGKDGAVYQVPKSTWLGGVLEAHLADRRSTMEQTISLFQPWTWGRITDGPGEGEEWTRGDYLSDE